jgi:GNAT superfamily N-acetyltransferase
MTTFHHRLAALADLPELEASFEIMGVDTRLIEDGTYFVIEEAGRILGCGGRSPRARAMYTHPDVGRRGIGRRVLSLCEAAAAREGFRTLELVATVAGEPLYKACGYSVTERIEVPTSKGATVPCARMTKRIQP